MGGDRRYTEAEVREAVAASLTLTETIRRLGLRAAGANHKSLRAYIAELGISTARFDPDRARRPPRRTAVPLAEVLVENSPYDRGRLKRRLIAEGLKIACCEMCGQGEEWRGRRMSLVLDHANGVWNDNRLKNLRMLCPNCNATLDTHCGRRTRRLFERPCALCGTTFLPRTERQRYCSRDCGQRGPVPRGPQPHLRKVERPPHEQLLREITETGYLAVGRKYGVSDRP